MKQSMVEEEEVVLTSNGYGYEFQFEIRTLLTFSPLASSFSVHCVEEGAGQHLRCYQHGVCSTASAP